ncbi:hypothetical protein DH2020_010798 [Rehmannia glutinosa]|uniref:Uncharacterized protein n=1 Tax=Rehmannia glutinosa TaxID=99300 RepID=A0ABR0XBL5_REHGL
MSSNSIFTSIESEKRWVLAMDKNFPQQHTVDIDFNIIPCCVFRVPKTLTESKPEAYAPQNLGLGPYHHLRPELYKMQQQKLAAIRKFLGPEKIHNFRRAVEALVQSEPVLRACYDQYLDLDIQTLAWILAIDGLYLLQFSNSMTIIRCLTISKLSVGQFAAGIERGAFCDIGKTDQVHLLHLMYYLILNNTNIQDGRFRISMFSGGVERILLDNVVDGLQFLGDRGLPGAGTAGQVVSFLEKVPWDKILGLFKKGYCCNNEQNPSVDEIGIPSVSQMTEIAGIKFSVTPGGIRDIRFDDHDENWKTFYLPVIKINAISEIILRNLVAYEAALAKPGSTVEVAEYVDLMCGIIDNQKDVDILRKEKIIESELDDEEIVSIFNGISKSMRKNSSKSNIEEAIDNVNARYDNLGRVKVKRFVQKYVYASLKLMSVLITIAVLVLLILQAFCSVFGCGRWFGKIGTQSGNLLFSDQ